MPGRALKKVRDDSSDIREEVEKELEKKNDDEEWEDEQMDELFDEMEEEFFEEDLDEDIDLHDEKYKEMKDEVTEQLNNVILNAEKGENDLRFWRPDQDSSYLKGDNMELQYSNKAYNSFFQLRTEYPCLSFDIINDEEGSSRVKYPLTMHLICGSQADKTDENQLYIMKLRNICKTKHDVEDDEDDDSIIGDAENSEDDEEGEEINDGDPIIEYRVIKHNGIINRIRMAPLDALRHRFCAVWSDAGHVQVFDIESEYRSLSDFESWNKEQVKIAINKTNKNLALLFSSPSSTHKTEGYAVEWNNINKQVFASGDCNGSIFTWTPTESSWATNGSNINGKNSVEDIRWSPTQPNIFICGRAGGLIQVWDSRDMKSSKLQWTADNTDINVIDWNKASSSSHILVSGADSGNVAIWDLRTISSFNSIEQKCQPLQNLCWHKKSITSVEFSSHNESVLSVASDDGQCTLWDLSLERDEDEEKKIIDDYYGHEDLSGLPDQLMFLHQGLVHPKEVHFHKQIPGMVLTTDFNTLHLFKPLNWKSLMK